ncbi:Uncharacterised protein [Mycobacteroides abscessus subsp. abscessus]|uniref:hypothetical protein n=1 Tax=Mycobacteroides abscessus TaxID=36809 RepID=UPI00092C8EE9|nr:hypothetical protein [Mycobacteroides abscessus]SIH35613.1 Uncharacterised protein [Mycobacteroides abscessus subsp. abscessus]
MEILGSKNLGVIDGFDVTAHLEADVDATPFEAECFDQNDIDAWRNDDWRFVGTVIKASKNGIELGEASIWASVYGVIGGKNVSPLDGEGDQFVNGYGPQLIDEAVSAAKAAVAKLV